MRTVMHAEPIEGHQDRPNLAVLPAHKLAKTPGTDLHTLYPLPSLPHITPRPSAKIHIYKVEVARKLVEKGRPGTAARVLSPNTAVAEVNVSTETRS
ncbi:hypothetical protein JCM24511_05308 [Saitozyma sp. JCM 24511]|nr:hypothetical protein JCM24511_05308 [Saitozyma sp. JCM 24511]